VLYAVGILIFLARRWISHHTKYFFFKSSKNVGAKQVLALWALVVRVAPCWNNLRGARTSRVYMPNPSSSYSSRDASVHAEGQTDGHGQFDSTASERVLWIWRFRNRVFLEHFLIRESVFASIQSREILVAFFRSV